MRDPGSVSYNAAVESAASRDTDATPTRSRPRSRNGCTARCNAAASTPPAAASSPATELRSHTETTDAARRCIDYIVRNRRRMRCPRFRAQDLCVSSGVVEAGCKRVGGARLKRAGMRWTGANAVTALRCCRLSGRFEDFRERRAARAA